MLTHIWDFLWLNIYFWEISLWYSADYYFLSANRCLWEFRIYHICNALFWVVKWDFRLLVFGVMQLVNVNNVRSASLETFHDTLVFLC